MKPSVKKSLGVVVIVAVIVTVIIVSVRSRPLEVISVERAASLPIEVFGLGTVEARVLSRVGFAVSGTLQSVHADHGDRIAAGEPLAVLDSATQAARVTKMEALLVQAEATQGKGA